jgi:hypothetical protein
LLLALLMLLLTAAKHTLQWWDSHSHHRRPGKLSTSIMSVVVAVFVETAATAA